MRSPSSLRRRLAPAVQPWSCVTAIAEKHSDTNKDCKHDEFVYYAEGRPQRAERDQDFDGRIDAWVYFGEDGKPARQEFDTTGDGKKDRWIQNRGGKPTSQLDDKNADGKPDDTS